jgi:hypothetical protein
MPKKQGKVDPTKLKEMFESWRTSKEGMGWTQRVAKLWDELLDIVKENRDVETLEDDFTEHYKFFFYKLQQLYDEMKVPKRPKSSNEVNCVEAFDQGIIRVYYFQNKKQDYICNGRKGEFEEREIPQDSLRMRGVFVDMIVTMRRKSDMTEVDYQSKAAAKALEIRKELTQKMTQLSVEYTKYQKSRSFKAITELLNSELRSLENLVTSSYSRDFFSERKTKGEVIPQFRRQAADELFVKSLDEVTQTLFSCQQLERPLDTALMLGRLDIPNWIHIRPFQFYLKQLEQKLDALKAVLQLMHKMGKSTYMLTG